MKMHKPIHRPGSLMDKRPVPRGQMERLNREDYEANPDRYAQKVWAQISKWAEGQYANGL
jgi:hypothetical protein